MTNSTNRPSVIFFDAVGTLFGVKDSVGHIYAAIAKEFGVHADPESLNRAFIQNFKTASKMAFPNVERSQIPQYEYKWWWAIAKSSFTQTGFIEQFQPNQDFDSYFERLYSFFATVEAWDLYAEVPETLGKLQKLDIELAIISNFDTRLYPVLKALDLAQFFTTVTISTEVGAAKPDRKIFSSAMNKHMHKPKSANPRFWHIGDSFKEDYEGAKNAGLEAIWLDRSKDSSNSISSLEKILDAI